MNSEQREFAQVPLVDTPPRGQLILQQDLTTMRGASCELDTEGHCITCSDEALPVRVLRVDQESGTALVEVSDTKEEIDITLVDSVSPGDTLLVHGGVAIALLDEATDE
jgi:hydrogenase assembly chaperone HypC/HupF